MQQSNRLGFLLKLVFLFAMFFSSVAFSAEKGKIAGRIVDKSTGEPMAGVNVIIEGTHLGTASDTDGFYFILNIPPGRYTVKAMMVGMTTVVKKDVEVNIDQTTTVNFKMQTEALKGEEIVVVAKRPVVKLDVSSSQRIMDIKAVESRPVDNFQELLSTEAGIRLTAGRGGNGLLIRGGGLNETNIVVDGLSTRDERTQQPMTNLSLTAIDEVQILTGGFNAEYGDIRSGMITVVTKEGSQDRYSANIDLRISPPARKHFGPSPYGLDGPFWPIYTGKDAFTGVTQAMVDSGEYAYPFVGWDEVAKKFLSDDDPNNDYTPQELLEIWKWQHRQIKYADKPDYIADATVSGPIPGTSIAFMLSERYENLQLAYPFSRKNSLGSTTMLKLTTHLSPSMKLSFTNMYMYQAGVSGSVYHNTTGLITGTREGTEYAQSAVSKAWLWHDATYNPIVNKQFRSGLTLNHVLSNKTFYDVRLEYTRFSTVQEPMRMRDTTLIKQIGYRWYDEAPFGYVGSSLGRGISERTDINDEFMMSGGGRGQDHSRYWGISFSADLVSQISHHHQIKSGLSLDYTYFRERREVNNSYTTQPWKEAPYNWVGYFNDGPLKVGAYIQDKMEFAGMIANMGVRLDYLNALTSPYNLNPSFIFQNHPYLYTNFRDNNNSFSQFTTNAPSYRLYISPRLGISHPVTETSKIFFNYGHFYQPPVVDRLYTVRVNNTGGESTIPNIRAKWPLTISYEVGFEQSLARDYLIRIMGYYKDVSDQLTPAQIISYDEEQVVNTYRNNSYADYRGLELRLEKRVGRWFHGFISYEYSIQSSGRTGLAVIYEDRQLWDRQRESAAQERAWPAPTVWANLTFSTPAEWGPAFGGSKILGDWRLNILTNWKDGGKELMNPGAKLREQHYADVIDYYNTDIMLEKRVKLSHMRIGIYMQIKNLFNNKGFPNPYNWNDYVNSLHFPWEKGDQKGNDKLGEWNKKYIKLGWNTYSQFINPRDIFFGLKIQL